MTENDVLLQQTEDGHHKFVDAPPRPIIGAMRVGALVELKSGGPAMTVEIWQDDIAHVVWFAGGTAVRDGFHWSMLKLAEPQEQSAPEMRPPK